MSISFPPLVEICTFCARILLVANCVPLNVRLADVVVVSVPLLNRTLLVAPTTFVAVVAVVELPLKAPVNVVAVTLGANKAVSYTHLTLPTNA